MQSKIYAYIRISKDTSDAENQRHEILSYHNNKVSPDWVEELVTGNSNADDRKLGELIERLQAGDTLVVADVRRLVAAGVSVSAIGRAYKLIRRTVTGFLKVKGLGGDDGSKE